MYYVTKEFTFDSAHQIKGHKGKCQNLHGHTYKLWVTCGFDKLNDIGVGIDFGDISKIVKENIVEKMDHKYLNDIIEPASAEVMAKYIFDELKTYIPVCEIRLWETPTSFVTYTDIW